MKRFFAFFLIYSLACVFPGGARADGSANSSEDGEYYLGAEDQLDIQVYDHADLSGPVRIDFNGMLQLPLIGEISAAGRSVTELAEYLTDRYQLLDSSIPEVIISISAYNSKSISVIGEVRSPGRYGFRTIPDIWAVILQAGGATSNADMAGVQVVRENEVHGETETLFVDLSDGIENTAQEELPFLQAKDTIIINAIGTDNIQGDKVQVLGAVRSPGMYRLSLAESVTEAIAASGGYLPNADLAKVRLTRVTNGQAISYKLDLEGYLYDARPAADFVLLPGDIITIPDKQSIFGLIVDNIIKLSPIITTVLSLSLVARN